jgi:hypothetical protein
MIIDAAEKIEDYTNLANPVNNRLIIATDAAIISIELQ